MNLRARLSRSIGGGCIHEWIRPVVNGRIAAALERVLDEPDRVAVAGGVQVRPLRIEDAVERLGRREAANQHGGERGGEDGLEALEDDGGDALEPVAVGGGGGGVAEEVWVDKGVDEGGHGEDDGEDGDGGGDGEGEV